MGVVFPSRSFAGLRLRLGTFLIEILDSRLRAFVTILVTGACAGVVEFAIHQSLRYSKLGRSLGAFMDSAAVGLAAAAVASLSLFAARERRKRVLQEMRKVAELNHHVRNALQVIAHSHYGSADEHTKMVLESVERIEQTLASLFPAIEGTKPPDGRRVIFSGRRSRSH